MKTIERICDMRSGMKLQVFVSDVDGDVHVSVLPADHRFGNDVEFCMSGTQSPQTAKALRAVAKAMQLDAESYPQDGFDMLPVSTMIKVNNDIAAERIRQVNEEGNLPEFDDNYSDNVLAFASAAYATGDGSLWPFKEASFKPTPGNRIRDLLKAGALLSAELETQYRKAAKEAGLTIPVMNENDKKNCIFNGVELAMDELRREIRSRLIESNPQTELNAELDSDSYEAGYMDAVTAVLELIELKSQEFKV